MIPWHSDMLYKTSDFPNGLNAYYGLFAILNTVKSNFRATTNLCLTFIRAIFILFRGFHSRKFISKWQTSRDHGDGGLAILLLFTQIWDVSKIGMSPNIFEMVNRIIPVTVNQTFLNYIYIIKKNYILNQCISEI